VGQTLNVPNRVTGAANNASTFKPYDPAKVVGDTTPTLNSPPPPPQKKGCGGLGSLIMVVVAVVATIYTAGALTGAAGSAGSTFMGTMQAGLGASATNMAIGGAVGSFASQVAGNVLGVQEGFNWKGVALSALSGGITAKLGTSAFTETFGKVGGFMARAAVANAMTQGVAVITGLQDKFDWRGVAASAVGAGVGQAVGGALGLNTGKADFGEQLGKRFVTGLASGTAAAVARGGRVAVQQIAVDAFGNALGSSLAGNSATATTGDFARMDGKGYRGEAYEGASEGGGSTSVAWADDVAARRFATNPLGLPTVGRTTAAIGADADNVNGLDLPADYALQSANPSDVARGDRLLRQQVNAEIDAAQVSAVRASADAYMKTSAAQAATLTNRDDSRTYRSASAGYRAAQASGLSYGGSPAAPGGSSVAAKGASPSQALTGLPGYGDGSDLVNAEFGGGSGQAGFAQNMQAFNRNIAAAKQDVLQSIADKRLGWGTAVAAEILIPGSFTEGALGAAGPIIGKVVGSGIAVANKVPWLGADVGVAAGRFGDDLVELSGKLLDNASGPRLNPQFGGALVDFKVANTTPKELYRLGQPVSPLERTFDHALSPQSYVEDIATHYGINLRGSGQNISVLYDDTLPAGRLGVTKEIEGGKVIRIGPDALVDQATAANTIAHELSHARDYLRGSHKVHGNAASLADRTVYGSGNALEDWITGRR
jgi:hypothetical protein